MDVVVLRLAPTLAVVPDTRPASMLLPALTEAVVLAPNPMPVVTPPRPVVAVVVVAAVPVTEEQY